MLFKESFAFLLLSISVVVCATNETQQEEGVSRQEFEQLKNDLHYWQNTTLFLMKDRADEYQYRCSLEELVEKKIGPVLSSINSSIAVTKSGVSDMDLKMDALFAKLNSSAGDVQPANFPLGSYLNPAVSCKNIPTFRSSGNYWIRSTRGYAQIQYCEMFPPCSCRQPPGWMKVVQLNMTDPQEHCPSGFGNITSPKRVCKNIRGPGCANTTFPVNGVQYSSVCGRIIGYQYSSPDAFSPYYNARSYTIDDGYVDGVSLTHGHSPRKHIWTFANAVDETLSQKWVCPCTKADSTYTGVVPPFIGNDYFCATGSRKHHTFHWYTEDPLWDGRGCGDSSTCCEFNNPPWFCKDLPQPTTDDIELRLCMDEGLSDENIGLEAIEIYVQ